MSVFKTILFFTLVSSPAMTEPAWRAFTNEETAISGAAVCPENSNGGWTCLMAACQSGGPLYLGWSVKGIDLGETLQGDLKVGRLALGNLLFTQIERGESLEYAAVLPREAFGFLDNISSAGTLDISLNGGGMAADFSFAYSGTEVLQRVADQCPVAWDNVPKGDELQSADPFNDVMQIIQSDCSAAGGTADVGDWFVDNTDLNGDGLNDLVFDFGAADCSTLPDNYCGTGGCRQSMWLSDRNGPFTQVYDSGLFGYGVMEDGTLQLNGHGGMCGRVGYMGCEQRYQFDGNRMVRVF